MMSRLKSSIELHIIHFDRLNYRTFCNCKKNSRCIKQLSFFLRKSSHGMRKKNCTRCTHLSLPSFWCLNTLNANTIRTINKTIMWRARHRITSLSISLPQRRQSKSTNMHNSCKWCSLCKVVFILPWTSFRANTHALFANVNYEIG